LESVGWEEDANSSENAKTIPENATRRTTTNYSSSSSSSSSSTENDEDNDENLELPPTQITQRRSPISKRKKIHTPPSDSSSSSSSLDDEQEQELEIPRPLSSEEEEELEIPYAQAFCNSQEQLRSILETRPREPLRCGGTYIQSNTCLVELVVCVLHSSRMDSFCSLWCQNNQT
jgi:hypothetical protein